MQSRLSLAALVLLVTLSMGASQIPRWAFAYDPDSCCCHHPGQCPCAGHHLPRHDKHDTARSCGSGGHELTASAAPVCDLPPAAAADVAPALPFAPPALAAPRAAPDREEPSAPS